MARSIAQATRGSSRNRSILLLAALFGLLSAGLMFAFLSTRGGDESVEETLRDAGEVETMVVMARDVAFGETITSDMLTEEPVPVRAILPSAYQNRADVEGLVAAAPLFAGEQVLPGKVTSTADQDTLAFKVPEGMRALSLEVPHEAWVNAGLPQPGDRVDVLALTAMLAEDPLTGDNVPEVRSRLMVQDVEVLALAQSLVDYFPETELTREDDDEDGELGGEASTATNGDGEDGARQAFRATDGSQTYEESVSVTLALLPEDAAKLALLDALDDEAGQYRILTRHQSDREIIGDQSNWTLEDLFELN